MSWLRSFNVLIIFEILSNLKYLNSSTFGEFEQDGKVSALSDEDRYSRLEEDLLEHYNL